MSAQSLSNTQKLASLCKVWGFLKYYHPQVAKGRIDWDQQLISLMPTTLNASNREQLALVYISLIDQLGTVKPCRKCLPETQIPDWQKRNLDLSFIDDTLTMTPTLREKLLYIKTNRNQGYNAYVSTYRKIGNADFSGENPYAEMNLPEEPYRLLALFRYWNAIQYYFPYKYAIQEGWNAALEQLIPFFEQANDTVAYQIALLKMVARIHDSHGFLGFSDPRRAMYEHLGNYFVPFFVKYIDQKAMMVGFFNDSIAVKNNLKHGMVITKINGEPLASVIDKWRELGSASNEVAFLRDLQYRFWRGLTPEIQVTIEENGLETTRSIRRYLFKVFKYDYRKLKQDKPLGEWLSDSIGYVHLGQLQVKQVDSMMNVFKNSKSIIFDLRTYPNGTMHLLARHLNPQPTVFTKLTKPSLTYPGIYDTLRLYAGNRRNPDYYRGKVVILVNEDTQSQAEFTAMILQTAPRSLVVGSQTAGADGEISWISLPGGYKTAMSGVGVYYPDGRETQRIGIVPDVQVSPTIQGIQAGRDEVLEKALELARKP
jgi:carboxyl-terminal processing protease